MNLKKILALVLVLAMCLSFIPTYAFADDGIELVEEEEDIVEVPGYTEPENESDTEDYTEETPAAPVEDQTPETESEPAVEPETVEEPEEEEEEEFFLFGASLSDTDKFEGSNSSIEVTFNGNTWDADTLEEVLATPSDLDGATVTINGIVPAGKENIVISKNITINAGIGDARIYFTGSTSSIAANVTLGAGLRADGNLYVADGTVRNNSDIVLTVDKRASSESNPVHTEPEIIGGRVASVTSEDAASRIRLLNVIVDGNVTIDSGRFEMHNGSVGGNFTAKSEAALDNVAVAGNVTINSNSGTFEMVGGSVGGDFTAQSAVKLENNVVLSLSHTVSMTGSAALVGEADGDNFTVKSTDEAVDLAIDKIGYVGTYMLLTQEVTSGYAEIVDKTFSLDLNGKKLSSTEIYLQNSNVTLKNGTLEADITMVSSTLTVNDAKVTIKGALPAKEGNTFNLTAGKYSVDPTDYIDADSYHVEQDETTKLYEIKSGVVRNISYQGYESYGATLPEDAPKTYVEEAEGLAAELALPTLDVKGYVFKGWDNNGTEKTEYLEKLPAKTKGNVTLTAKFEADTNVAKVGEVKYQDIDDAIVAALDTDQSVKVLLPCEISDNHRLNKDIEISNFADVTFAENAVLSVVDNKTLTIDADPANYNGKIVGLGSNSKLVATVEYAWVNDFAGNAYHWRVANAVAEVYSAGAFVKSYVDLDDAFVDPAADSTVWVFATNTELSEKHPIGNITIHLEDIDNDDATDVEISSAVMLGMFSVTGPVTINGSGTINHTSTSVRGNVFSVDGGMLTLSEDIEVKAAKNAIKVNSGALALADAVKVEAVGTAIELVGGSLVIDSEDVSVSGKLDIDADAAEAVTITAGSFTDNNVASVLGEDYCISVNPDGDGYYEVLPAVAKAVKGNDAVRYPSLQDALDYAEEGSTISLLTGKETITTPVIATRSDLTFTGNFKYSGEGYGFTVNLAKPDGVFTVSNATFLEAPASTEKLALELKAGKIGIYGDNTVFYGKVKLPNESGHGKVDAGAFVEKVPNPYLPARVNTPEKDENGLYHVYHTVKLQYSYASTVDNKDNPDKGATDYAYAGADWKLRTVDGFEGKYDFDGWTIKETASATDLDENGKWHVPDDAEGTINLVAKYKPVKYTVTFDLNGGTLVGTDSDLVEQKVDYLATATDLDTLPTKNGYVFAGWRIPAANETSDPVGIGPSKFYDFNTQITKDITLKAYWAQGANRTSLDEASMIYSDIAEAYKSYMGVCLLDDVTLQKPITLGGSSSDKTLNLNGKTLTFDLTEGPAITVPDSYKLNVSNGKIVSNVDVFSNSGELTVLADVDAGVNKIVVATGTTLIGSDTMAPFITGKLEAEEHASITVNAGYFSEPVADGYVDGKADSSEATYTASGKLCSNNAVYTDVNGNSFYVVDDAVTFTFKKQDGTTDIEAREYAKGDYVLATDSNLPDFGFENVVNNGYEQFGWTNVASHTDLSAWGEDDNYYYDFGTKLAGNETVYPVYDTIKYTITYNGMEGATWTDFDRIDTYTVNDGTIKVPMPTKVGYYFAGWVWGHDGSMSTDAYLGVFSFDAATNNYNLVLNATWTPNEHLVTYDPDGGTFDASVKTTFEVRDQDAMTAEQILATDTVIRKGYTNKGWATSTDVNATAFDFSTKITDNITLYPIWEAVEYTITYDLDEGEWPEGANVVTEFTIEDGEIPVPAPKRVGYFFNGWYSKKESAANFSGPASINAIYSQYAAVDNWILKAAWTDDLNKVTYDADGGTFATGTTTEFDVRDQDAMTADQILATDTVIREGYTNLGWTDEKNSTEKFDFTTKITDPITLYPIWQVNNYHLTINSNYEGGPATETDLDYGDTIELPDWTRDYYDAPKFVENFGGEPVVYTNDSTMPARNVNLDAEWTLTTYNISYSSSIKDAVSGNPVKASSWEGTAVRSYNYESKPITIQRVPVWDNYDFVGYTWVGMEGTEPVREPVIATHSHGDITFTAVATPKQYTVTIDYKYDDENGSNYTVQGDYAYGTALSTILEAEPEREGYTFDGWYTSADYADNSKVGENDKVSGTATYYAKWIGQLVIVRVYNDDTYLGNVSVNRGTKALDAIARINNTSLEKLLTLDHAENTTLVEGKIWLDEQKQVVGADQTVEEETNRFKLNWLANDLTVTFKTGSKTLAVIENNIKTNTISDKAGATYEYPELKNELDEYNLGWFVEGTTAPLYTTTNPEAENYIGKFVLDDSVIFVPTWEDAKYADFTYNMTLGDGLSLYFNAKNITDDAEYAISVDGADPVALVEGESIKLGDFTAIEMTKTVKVVVTRDGVEIKNEDYSIQKYCKSLIENSENEKLQALAHAVLVYGTKAQLGIKDADKENLPIADEAVDVTLPDINTVMYKVTGKVDAVTRFGRNLQAQAIMEMRVFFQLASDADIENFNVYIDGEETDKITAMGGNTYYVTIPVPALKLDTKHSVIVEDSESGALTIHTCSALYPIVNMNSNGNNNELAKAMYAYYLAAYDYFGNT